MSQASDYPVTFPYGAVDNVYYGPQAVDKSTYIGPYHRGDDRAMPMGTPVVMNGATIGLSGNGNGRYGAHLHVGRFVGGADTDPHGLGFSLPGAVVTKILNDYSDPVNGKYVWVRDASGATWVYLHLSQITCVVGQVLSPAPQQGEAMITDSDNEFWRWDKLFVQIRGRMATRDEFRAAAVGKTWLQAMEILSDSTEADANQRTREFGQSASTQLATQSTTIDTLNLNIKNLTDDNVSLKTELAAAVAKETPAPVPQNTYEPAVSSPSWLVRLIARFKKS